MHMAMNLRHILFTRKHFHSAQLIGASASVETEEGREKSVQTPEMKKRARVTLRNNTLRIAVSEHVVHSNV
jgi:hypothetical protein